MTNHGLRSCLVFCLVLALAPSMASAEDLSAGNWKLKLDPPATPPPTPASKDFAIPFPANFGGGGETLYPSTSSQFVAIGKNAFDKDVRQVWDLSTRKLVGSFRGQIGFDEKTIALSSDGAHLVGKPTFRKSIEVRATKNGRVVQTIDIESPFLNFIDFAGNDRVVYGSLSQKRMEVRDIKTGDKVCDVALVESADKDAIAISPGGAYLAAVSWPRGSLRAYDLATGQLVGQAPTPKVNGQNVRCFGLAFSPDGAELAGLFEYFGAYRIVCWDAATGKMLANHDLGKEIQRPTFYSASGIEWFPDKSAWLVLGHAIVDRAAGKKVWTLAFDSQNLKPSPRRFLDNDHVMVVTYQPSMALRTGVIPRDKIAGAAKIVKSGGNAADAALPPIHPADTSGAKLVSPDGQNVAWSVAPKVIPPSRKRLTPRPLTINGKAEDIRAILFPAPDSSLAVLIGTPQQFGQPNPTDGQPRWIERFDLASGKALSKVDLPNVVDPIAVSPDGMAVLLREAKVKDRLDVVSAVDGKPVTGWRPYEKDTADAKGVAWAAFLDANRVLTVSQGGTLVLWSLPKCKAVYIAEEAFLGSPVLSPDRSVVAGFDGRNLRILNAETGLPKGESAAPAALGPRPEMKAAAFRPDGQEFAAIFQNSTVARWNLKTGKLATEFVSTWPVAGTSLDWADNDHLVLDNRLLVNLTAKRPVWEYIGGTIGSNGPDGRRWVVVRGVADQNSGRLVSIDPIDPSLEKAEALLADAKSPAVLRPGFRVSLQFNMNGPPGNAQGYRQELANALGAKLKQNGMTVVDDGVPVKRPSPVRVSFVRSARRAAGPDARLVINVREQDSGKTIQYRRIGRGLRNIQVVKLIDLVCEMSLVDATGAVACAPVQTVFMQPRGFVLRMPAGENDPEIYLKKLQWGRIKTWATNPGPPYFVARDGNNVVRLPGRTDLNAAFAN